MPRSSSVRRRDVTPVHASLTDFELPERVDAVFSNAVFHWIPDDDALFGALFRATKPRGRLRAQCGGAGNNAHVLEAVEAVREQAPFRAPLADIRDGLKGSFGPRSRPLYDTPNGYWKNLERVVRGLSAIRSAD